MAEEHSFDIVCEVNIQEVTNAIDQAMKEIRQRFDFKGSRSNSSVRLCDRATVRQKLERQSDCAIVKLRKNLFLIKNSRSAALSH
jgi:uncharacterized protein YajQ (UPF0234 family)